MIRQELLDEKEQTLRALIGRGGQQKVGKFVVEWTEARVPSCKDFKSRELGTDSLGNLAPGFLVVLCGLIITVAKEGQRDVSYWSLGVNVSLKKKNERVRT